MKNVPVSEKTLVAVLYHKDCQDGLYAAVSIDLWYDIIQHDHYDIYFYPCSHANGLKQASHAQSHVANLMNRNYADVVVYYVDYCPKSKNEVTHWNNLGVVPIVYDHHKTAEPMFHELNEIGMISGLFDGTRSGAKITYEEHFGKSNNVIDLVSKRDLWDLTDEVEWFFEAEQNVRYKLEKLNQRFPKELYLLHCKEMLEIDFDDLQDHISNGQRDYELGEMFIEQTINSTQPIYCDLLANKDGYLIPLYQMPIPRLTSRFMNRLMEIKGCKSVATYIIRDDWTVDISFRSANPNTIPSVVSEWEEMVDVGEVAKNMYEKFKLSGGGHANASGCVIPLDAFANSIKTR